MKRFFIGLLAVILCIVCCGCADFQHVLEQQLAAPGTVALITARLPDEFSDLDADVLTGQNMSDPPCSYRMISADTITEQLAAVKTAAGDPSTAVLVVELFAGGYAQSVVDIAAKHSLPLLLCGVRPSEQVMNSYDSCWYVGFDPVLAAELQSGILVRAFRQEKLLDQNGDYKQTGLLLTTMAGYEHQPNDYSASIIHNMELGGVHTYALASPLFAADETALYQQLDTLLLPQVQVSTYETQENGETVVKTNEEVFSAVADAEFIVCADVAASHAAIQAVTALHAAAADEVLSAYATPARTYALICFGYSDSIADGLQSGVIWGTVVRDKTAATNAVLALSANLAQGYSLTKNTDYHLHEGKYLMLDYQVLTAKELS